EWQKDFALDPVSGRVDQAGIVLGEQVMELGQGHWRNMTSVDEPASRMSSEPWIELEQGSGKQELETRVQRLNVRHRHDDVSTRLHDATHLADKRVGLDHMLDTLEAHDHIESGIFEGKRLLHVDVRVIGAFGVDIR